MRPETRELYPDNWPEISQACIERANRVCKDCSRSDRTDRIILTSHHKDYDPSHNEDDNLVCLCQGCHLRRQARDLAEATRLNKVDVLMRMGQLCFEGMKPEIPRRLDRVMSGKALATSPRRGYHARPGIGQSPGQVYQAGKG